MTNVYYKTQLGYMVIAQADWEGCAPEGKRPELLDPNKPDDDFLQWLQAQPDYVGKTLSKGRWIVDASKQAELNSEGLKQAKAAAIVASVNYADNLQAAILGEASPAAQARLAGKYDTAVAIKAGTANAGDHAVIDAEVSLRPKYTKEQLVDVIVTKGTAAKQAEGMVNGMLLLAQDAIEAATTLESLATATSAITAKADALKAQLMAALQED